MADDRGLRAGVPPVTEGVAALRRAGAAASGPRRPGDGLPLLHPGPAGAGPPGGVAAATRHAAGPDPHGVRPPARCRRRRDPRVLGAGGDGHGRTPGPRRVPRRRADGGTEEGHHRARTALLRPLGPRPGPARQPGHRLRGCPPPRGRRRIRPGRRPRQQCGGGGTAVPGHRRAPRRQRPQPPGRRRARGDRGGTGRGRGQRRERHHPDRPAVDRLPPRPGPHRRLPGLPAARRCPLPHHPRPHGGPVTDRRGPSDRGGGRHPSPAGAAPQGPHHRHPGPATARRRTRRPLPPVLRRPLRRRPRRHHPRPPHRLARPRSGCPLPGRRARTPPHGPDNVSCVVADVVETAP